MYCWTKVDHGFFYCESPSWLTIMTVEQSIYLHLYIEYMMSLWKNANKTILRSDVKSHQHDFNPPLPIDAAHIVQFMGHAGRNYGFCLPAAPTPTSPAAAAAPGPRLWDVRDRWISFHLREHNLRLTWRRPTTLVGSFDLRRSICSCQGNQPTS